jgi:DNA/RNA endonuclease G (NUC1)
VAGILHTVTAMRIGGIFLALVLCFTGITGASAQNRFGSSSDPSSRIQTARTTPGQQPPRAIAPLQRPGVNPLRPGVGPSGQTPSRTTLARQTGVRPVASVNGARGTINNAAQNRTALRTGSVRTEASAPVGGDLEIDDRANESIARQSADDASLPRMHGVFDGGHEGARATIQEAWSRVQQGDSAITSRPGRVEGATVYRVPMGREVGFLGGQRGAASGNPRANMVELVVRQNRLLVAYPVTGRAGATQPTPQRTATPLARTAPVRTQPVAQTQRTADTNGGGYEADAIPELEISDRTLEGITARSADAPDSDRVHTVFEGGTEGALAVIHEAWTHVQQNSDAVDARPGREEGVTVYRVNLDRNIGFVGGREGAQQNNPRTYSVDLVVRGNRLVSAWTVRDPTRVTGNTPAGTLRLEGRSIRLPSTPVSPREAVNGRVNERAQPARALTVQDLRDRLLQRARDSQGNAISRGRAQAGAVHLANAGLPSDPDENDSERDMLIVSHDSVISYNPERMVPNWQAWTMSADTMGDAPRTDDIRGPDRAWERERAGGLDPRLPRTTPQARNADYQRSGFHRGHIRDSGAFTRSTALNSRTYTLTNAVPQAPNSNLGAWNGLEQYLRHEAREGSVINIVAGPLFRGDAPRTIGNGVNVPTALWKIAIINPAGTPPGRITPQTRIIAAIFPNNGREARRDQSWTDFRTSPRVIEQQTGLRFFTNLPAGEAESLRDSQDATDVPEELRTLRSYSSAPTP